MTNNTLYIDLGYRNIGCACLCPTPITTYITTKNLDVGKNLKYIKECFYTLINKYKINKIIYEKPYNLKGKSINTYYVEGLLYIICSELSIELDFRNAIKIKKKLTNNGRATKQEIEAVVRNNFPELPSNLSNHEIDAIAIYLYDFL